MEAEKLPDGRIRLVLSQGEDGLMGYSLLEAASVLARDDESRASTGISAVEAGAFDDEWSILRRRLYGPPQYQPQSEVERQRYAEYLASLPKEPRKTSTVWNGRPRMEAERLSDGRIAYTLARGELAIFAGAIDEMLRLVVRDRDVSSRGELSARSGRKIEEFEALRDALWRSDYVLRGKPEPTPRYNPPRPKVSSGRVGDVATFASEHRRARAWSRERDPVTDECIEACLLADGRARIVVSALLLQQLYEAFWPWHSMYWDEPDFVGPGGASAEQAQELRHEISTIRLWLDVEWRERWARKGVTLCEVRDGRILPLSDSKETLRAWGDVPVVEAEELQNGRIALVSPLVKLKVLVGYMEISLIDKERYRRFYRDFTEEEAEAFTNDLWQAYDDLSRELAGREETSEGEEA